MRTQTHRLIKQVFSLTQTDGQTDTQMYSNSLCCSTPSHHIRHPHEMTTDPLRSWASSIKLGTKFPNQ